VSGPGARPAGVTARAARLTTAAVLLLVTLVGFEALAVATAMPTVAAALDGLALYPVAFGTTTATSVVGMVVGGLWCDRGRAPWALWSGVLGFVLGLLVCGTAAHMLVVVLGRAVVGVGFGLVYVSLYVLVARVHTPERRPRVFAAIAAAWVLPGLLGPLVAGTIVEAFGWRWVFLAVAPLAVPAALLLLPALATLRHEPATPPAAGDRSRVLRAVLAAVGVAVLYVGGQVQHHRAAGALLGLCGLALLARSVPALLPPGTGSARRGLPAVVALRTLIGASFTGAQVVLPLVLQVQRGLGPVGAGGILSVGLVAWAAGSWVQGRTAARVAAGTVARAGVALMAGGTAAAALLVWPAAPLLVGALGWAFAGLGMGLVFPTLAVVALGVSPVAEHGTSSGQLQIGDSLGSALMLALTGAVFAALVARSAPAAFLVCFAAAVLAAVLGTVVAGRVPSPQTSPDRPA